MEYQQITEFIRHSEWLGSKLGLENSRNLLKYLGNPQDDLKFIHIAGTNGKGSVSAMLQSILTVSGYKTGRCTSPVITRLNEYMAIDGEFISDEDFVKYGKVLKSAAEEMMAAGEGQPTVFELVTALAFLYFKGEDCDIVVLEVGMGGALDSTNVIACPELAIITPIGLDHMAQLGETVDTIAREKAGIIKPGGTVVSAKQVSEVRTVLEDVCRERGAELFFAQEGLKKASDLSGQRFDYQGFQNIEITLLGDYQVQNAAVVCEAVLALKEKGYRLDGIREGFQKAKWPGRFEILQSDPLVILDGAHNVQGAQALRRSLEALGEKEITLVMGVMADKDFTGVLREMLPLGKRFVTVTPENPRALSAKNLAEQIKNLGADASAAESVAKGVETALRFGGTVCCFGSLYMTEEIRRYFGKENA